MAEESKGQEDNRREDIPPKERMLDCAQTLVLTAAEIERIQLELREIARILTASARSNL